MKLQVEGVSELVLEVQLMERAVAFWSGKLGFAVVEQWSYTEGQFDTGGAGKPWATWLYVGGNTRLGLWLPRQFSHAQTSMKHAAIHQWRDGLYDEGGIHVHFALYVKPEHFADTAAMLRSMDVDILVFPVEDSAASSLYFKDPEGNVVELFTKNMQTAYGQRIKKGLTQKSSSDVQPPL